VSTDYGEERENTNFPSAAVVIMTLSKKKKPTILEAQGSATDHVGPHFPGPEIPKSRISVT
jgi:hypothetical protein